MKISREMSIKCVPYIDAMRIMSIGGRKWKIIGIPCIIDCRILLHDIEKNSHL